MIELSEPFRFGDGLSVGVGGLPHRDIAAGAAFAFSEFDVATVPSLPALGGTMVAEVLTPVDGDELLPLHAFLELAAAINHDGDPVKWQVIGPVTLGVELQRGGLDTRAAFATALSMVRDRLDEQYELVSGALPNSPQLVLLDEPWFVELMSPGFVIAPDTAVDLVSTAMAALPTSVATGVHCCGDCDVAMILASGPQVISVPAEAELVDWAGYLSRFLDDDGVVIWGVIPTEGPLPQSADRQWRALSDVWCGLVQRGCDPALLRQQSLVSPECGLGAHSVATARRIARMTREVGRRVKDQSAATRLSLGA